MLLLLSQFHLISSGQNKNDTEKWLSYNLNKYFYGGENGTLDLYKAKQIAKERGSCEWESRNYNFEGNNFLIRIVDYKIDASLSMNEIKNILYTFDLSRLLKVSQETNVGVYSYGTKIIFEFQRKLYNGLFPYKEYDEINHKYITVDNFDYTIIKIEGGDYKEEISSDRFVKAFERLAELDGADIIKDVY